MGERVVINPGGNPAPEPQPAVPLGYAQRDAWSARMGRAWAPFAQEVSAFVGTRLGGWRRVAFALGVSLTFAGFSVAVAERNHDWAAFWTALGGLLVGLTVPLRGLDEPRP